MYQFWTEGFGLNKSRMKSEMDFWIIFSMLSVFSISFYTQPVQPVSKCTWEIADCMLYMV